MSGIEALYPFLYDSGDEPGDTRARVVAEVRRSTREKVAETAALRETVLATYADELAGCATAMARAFAAGARLFAFGNGGSSTDAQAVVEIFAVPPDGGPALPAVAGPGRRPRRRDRGAGR